AARVALQHAEEHARQFRRLHKEGAAPAATLLQAERDVALLRAQLVIKEAELREPEVRLRQVRRRLAQLQLQAAQLVDAAHVESWAQMLLDRGSDNLGSIPRGETRTVQVRLTNKLTVPVRVSAVRTTASFLTATVPQKDLAPGKYTILDITLDSSRFT